MPMSDDDDEAHPVGGEVAGDEAGEDVERGAALARRGDDLAHVARVGGGEDLDDLGDDRAGERAAGDDRPRASTRECRRRGRG